VKVYNIWYVFNDKISIKKDIIVFYEYGRTCTVIGTKEHNELNILNIWTNRWLLKYFLTWIFSWLIELPAVYNNVPNYNSHDYREWKKETIQLY